MRLNLTEKAGRNKDKGDYMGFLLVTCTLSPKTQNDKEQVSADKHDKGLTDRFSV